MATQANLSDISPRPIPASADDDQLLDYAGAAEFLKELCGGKGPTVSTLQSWVSGNDVNIPYLKVGARFVRFRKTSLRLWIRSREQNVPAVHDAETSPSRKESARRAGRGVRGARHGRRMKP